MLKYILKRLAFMIVSLFVISALTFWMMHTVPGDPLSNRVQKNLPPQVMENFMKKYGLDLPIHEQYGLFIKNALKGDLGESVTYPGMKITDTIKKTAPVSGKLGFIALLIGVSIGILMGFVAALNRGKWPDYIVVAISIIGVTIPSFVMASLLQYFLGNKFRLLPIMYKKTDMASFIMPIIALAFGSIATYSRYVRSSVLEVVNSDYVLTARAKGVSELGITVKHILKNSLIPAITLLGPQLVGIFSGSFIIEKIFNVPGLGRFMVQSISDRDYPMIISTTVLFGLLFAISQLVVDIVYGFVDPRIRLSDE